MFKGGEVSSGKLKSLNSVEFEEFFAPPQARP